MSDVITDWIKTRRDMEAAATDEPWEDDGGDIAQHWSRPEPWAMVVDTEVSCMAYCYGGSAAGVIRAEDAAFIVDARTSLPLALHALEAVLDLHKPREVEGIAGDCAAEECDHEDGKECERVTLTICAACDDFAERVHPYYAEQNWRESEYPCLVVTAITDALGVES